MITSQGQNVAYYDLQGAVADENSDVKICKHIQDEELSVGDIILQGFAEKPQAYAHGYNIVSIYTRPLYAAQVCRDAGLCSIVYSRPPQTFRVAEGAIMLTVNEKKKKVLKQNAAFMIKDGRLYHLTQVLEE